MKQAAQKAVSHTAAPANSKLLLTGTVEIGALKQRSRDFSFVASDRQSKVWKCVFAWEDVAVVGIIGNIRCFSVVYVAVLLMHEQQRCPGVNECLQSISKKRQFVDVFHSVACCVDNPPVITGWWSKSWKEFEVPVIFLLVDEAKVKNAGVQVVEGDGKERRR